MRIVLMYSTHSPSLSHMSRLGRLPGVSEVVVADSDASAAQAVSCATIILGHRYLKQSLPFAPQLRWVQSTAGGVDRLPLRELAAKNVMLSRMPTASPAIARHAVTLAWSLARCLPALMLQQQRGIWNNNIHWPAAPRKAMVMGYGSIGQEIARLLVNDGIEVIAVRRQVASGQERQGVRVVTGESWREELGSVQWLILALPASESTHHLIDASVLGELPAGAIVVNVGRGETLVHEDLCRLLREGHLHGAGLDVMEPKPQGADDPIWRTPGLIITPHVASHCLERAEQMEAYVEQQVARFLRGETPLDLVL